MKKICALIPSYNEAKTIGVISTEIRKLGLEVYVVDDGSTDDTAKAASGGGAMVIRHAKNEGKGAALRKGFEYILNTDCEAVIVMDGDNQHNVSDIPNFIKKWEETGADIVIGNRMDDVSSMPIIRIWTNKLMSALISRISGNPIPDTQNGFKLIRRKVLEKIKLKSSRYEIDSEIIIKAAKSGFKIESIPMQTVYGDEKSRINPIIDTLRFIRLLVKIGAGK